MENEKLWDAALYDDRHRFVSNLGRGVVELLSPGPGERVLDVGCGTGQLTAAIAKTGAAVTGVDASPSMIERARASHPGLDFRVQDATEIAFDAEFDAVFSNAALHWIKPPEVAAGRMAAALKPGGRLVIEMGGRGNVASVLAAAEAAGAAAGLSLSDVLHVNYFPSVGEYSTLLENVGFEVTSAALFDRPTPLEGDDALLAWLRMFRPEAMARIGDGSIGRFSTELKRTGAPMLRAGVWQADYRRLRVTAVRG